MILEWHWNDIDRGIDRRHLAVSFLTFQLEMTSDFWSSVIPTFRTFFYWVWAEPPGMGWLRRKGCPSFGGISASSIDEERRERPFPWSPMDWPPNENDRHLEAYRPRRLTRNGKKKQSKFAFGMTVEWPNDIRMASNDVEWRPQVCPSFLTIDSRFVIPLFFRFFVNN